MHPKAPHALLLATLLLVLAAGLVLAVESRGPGARAVRARDFQELVGGLGFGPAVDLSGCGFAFDPRLDPRCSEDQGPIPAGSFFCPYHTCSVFWYPALERTP